MRILILSQTKYIFSTLCFVFLLQSFNSLAQDSVSFKVKVEGFKNINGKLMVALYDSELTFLNKEFLTDSTQVDNSVKDIAFIVEGNKRYAVAIFHDENDNGVLDKNGLGIPVEPYAFGNNATGWFGPPTFFEASILIENTDTVMVIKLE